MSFRFLISTFILSFALASAVANGAGVKITAVEDARETDSKSLLLPGSDSGTLLIRGCQVCNDSPLQLTRDSKFFVGKTAYSLADFKGFLAEAKHNVHMVVFYKIGERAVTRIVATG